MARRLRYIPKGGALVEVTCRTVHGRFLLKPSRRLNWLILGVLGRAQRKYPLEIIECVFLSNHYHLLVWTPDAQRLAAFMNFLNGNIAREAGRLANWREKFWSRRYQAIVISDEPRAQIERLEYLLSHGVKEGFVQKPSKWPGIHSAKVHKTGEPLEGIWVDRSKLYSARVRGEKLDERQCETTETVTLSKLPCWEHLDDATYKQRISEVIERIEKVGKKNSPALTLTHPHHQRPRRSKRSPTPLFHCASKRIRRELSEAYSWFVVAYRDATERLLRGDPSPGFPEGSFPPALPYVA